MKSKVLELIKKIAFEFIIVIFILGFFSVSMQNYLLPKVEVTFPKPGYIVRTVPIHGQIIPKDEKKLKLANDAVIDEVYVFYGQRISEGTPLFKIRGEYENLTSDLNDMRKELSIMEKNLDVYKISDDEVLEQKIIEKQEKLVFEANILDGYMDMYNEGAISKNKLMEKELEVNSLKTPSTPLKSSRNETNLNQQIKIEELQLDIAQLKREIENLEGLDAYYLRVDEDNICYSEISGVVTGVFESSRKNDTVFQIATMKDFSTVKYIAYVDEEYKDDVKPGRAIKLYRDNINLSIVCIIRYVCEAAEDGKLKVVAEFPSGVKGIPTLNAGYDGRVERRKKVKSMIPNNALMPHDKLLPNRKASSFVVEEQKGVLTTLYKVKEITLTIEDVGDDYIEVSGAELSSRNEYKGYVTNISNKIYDGVRVYSEEF